MKVGIIGCGNISETYFNCQKIFNNFEIIACADINTEFANESAEKFNIKAQSVDDILSNKDIDLIINLTIPSAHKEIIIKSLNVRLCILYIFKNSTGTNKTNNETQNRIKNQNKPCAFQVMIDFSTIPTDSSKR